MYEKEIYSDHFVIFVRVGVTPNPCLTLFAEQA
jgi:hypothetical protein